MKNCNHFNFQENVNAKVIIIENYFKNFHLLNTRTKVFKNCYCCYYYYFFFIVHKYMIPNNADNSET